MRRPRGLTRDTGQFGGQGNELSAELLDLLMLLLAMLEQLK